MNSLLFKYSIVALLLLATCEKCNKVSAEKQTFENYKVYTINVENDEQLRILRDLEDNDAEGFEFWRSPAVIGQTADLMVAPKQAEQFNELIDKLSLKFTVMVEDVQSLIDNERPKIQPRVFNWTDYQTLDQIYSWLDEKLVQYPTILTNHLVGTSYEGRPIRAVRLSYKAGNPTIFLESNIHAREWITSATATWFLNELLTSTNPAVVDLAQNIDWVIIPVLNVDGFVYTHTTNRLWRKTRSLNSPAHLCYGVDGNRNFGFMWMYTGASSNPCSDTFAGPTPTSEVESQALVSFFNMFSTSVRLYLSFHSYGQYLLFPYGHTAQQSPHHDLLTAVGEKTGAAIAERYGTVYRVGPSSTVLYVTSGTSVDWAFAEHNVRLAYTFEFRGGSYGFVLPANQIIPNAEEILDGLIAMVAESRAQGAL